MVVMNTNRNEEEVEGKKLKIKVSRQRVNEANGISLRQTQSKEINLHLTKQKKKLNE